MEPIFLTPVLQEKIWGGQELRSQFGLEIPSDQTGEAWLVSAHPNGVASVSSPEQYAGMGLDALYDKEPALFGPDHPQPFPLLTKIIDAHQDLSVQVHPDDAYAQAHEGPQELGKTECWYIIAAKPGAEIVYGHSAQSPEEFRHQVAAGNWEDLLNRVPVQAGDFFYVPHGTIHAIGAGIVLLEVQQNSDTTYRVYDYDRLGQDGHLRPLHLEDSIAVTQYPHEEMAVEPKVQTYPGGQVTHYLTNDYFTVEKWSVTDSLTQELSHAYSLGTVISGQGELLVDGESYPLEPASTFILPHGLEEVELTGGLEVIMAYPEGGSVHE